VCGSQLHELRILLLHSASCLGTRDLNMGILLMGGLGNQLFQALRGHQVSDASGKSTLIYTQHNPPVDRHFQLKNFNEYCTHLRLAKKWEAEVFRFLQLLVRLTNSRFSNTFFDWFLSRLPIRSAPLAYPLRDVFQSSTERFIIEIGYFQNWQYLHMNSSKCFVEELSTYLEKNIEPIPNYIPSVFIAVHARRGDLQFYSSTMGILSHSYYSSLLNHLYPDMNLRPYVIVLSDDIEYGTEIARELKANQFAGPELDPWLTLKIFTKAQVVISANSTLSWWGGYLASLSGSTVVIPHPWFQNWSEDPGEAFCHPNFLRWPSNFLRTKTA